MADNSAELETRDRSRFGWIVVVACMLSQMVGLGFSLNCFTLFLPGWTLEFHSRASELTTAITVFSMGAALVSPFIGVAVDRYPARWLFAGAMVGLAAFHFLMSMVGAAWQLLGLYGLFLPLVAGFATAIPCQAIISRWFAGGPRLGLALGVGAMGLQLGGVVLPSAVADALPVYGWRVVFQIFAAVTLFVMTPMMFLIMREPARLRTATRDFAGHSIIGTTASVTVVPVTTRAVLVNANFWKLVAVFMPIQFAGLAVLLNLAPMITGRGFDLTAASSIVVAMSVTALCAKLVAGLLADRFGYRVPLAGTAMAVAGGLLALSFSGSSFALFIFGALLIGLGGGVWPLVGSGVASEFGTAGFGRAFGLIVTIITFSSFAPPIFAYTQERTGTYLTGLNSMAALAVLGGLVALTLRKRISDLPGDQELAGA